MQTFYIETFGCQMNAHDSEKVIGTLLSQGYRQVPKPEEADLVLYNTCSIRDKAEQKVFHRLDEFKRDHKGKVFGVLGCVAQQEGERIFERAPHVSLVAGSASYAKLPEMLVQLEAGGRRVTGLSLDNDQAFDTPFTKRDNPHRAYITIIEGCDKSCAYCVVPFTRGPERSRTSQSVLDEARELARMGYAEIQLLGQNVNSYRDPSPAGIDFARLLRAVGEVDGIRRVRFTTSHPRDFVKDIIDAIDDNPVLCNHVHLPVQSGSSSVLERMQRLYTRDEYMRRIDWMRQARRNISITTDIIVGFPGETEADFDQTLALLDEVQYDSLFSFKYSRRPNTSALELPGHVPEDEKSRRLAILQEKQRAIQISRNSEAVATIEEAFVEGYNHATGQWIGRTTQNRTLNFVHPQHAGPREGATLDGHLVERSCYSRGSEFLSRRGSDLSLQPKGGGMEVEMKIRGLMMDPVTNMPIVVLKDINGNAILPIWVGIYEANAIALEIEKVSTPRPMTHDLIKTLLLGLGTGVRKVVVSELKDDTFYAVIWLDRDGELISVDSRPSDALALALRLDCPIYVDESVLKSSKRSNAAADKASEEEQRRWLESLDDEDLGRYKM